MSRSIKNFVITWGWPTPPMPNNKYQLKAVMGPRVPQGPMKSGSVSQSVRLISDIPPPASRA